MVEKQLRNVFILGSKGIPAQYGGFETFADSLTKIINNKQIMFHVSCFSNENNNEYIYNNARCFNVKINTSRSINAILYDLKSLKLSIEYIKKNKLRNSIIYMLTYRIGPFLYFYEKKLNNYGIRLIINPDGLEWKRKKWSRIIRIYWRFSELLTFKVADFIICDSREIKKYVTKKYPKYNNVIFIPYSTDLKKSIMKHDEPIFNNWLKQNDVKRGSYYLMIGRVVPENNHEIIIEEFIKSSNKSLVIISNDFDYSKYSIKINNKFNIVNFKNIKFIPAIYNRELLKKIRENAFCYIHGHEVGGTNPSLLESLASTKLSLVLDVSFNKEVAGNSVIYFKKERNSLKNKIREAEELNDNKIRKYESLAKSIIKKKYDPNIISRRYEEFFLSI